MSTVQNLGLHQSHASELDSGSIGTSQRASRLDQSLQRNIELSKKLDELLKSSPKQTPTPRFQVDLSLSPQRQLVLKLQDENANLRTQLSDSQTTNAINESKVEELSQQLSDQTMQTQSAHMELLQS